MTQFLVVHSNYQRAGRGVNGRTLVCFLRAYAGRRRVRSCTPAQLLASSGIRADTVFIGLPSQVDGEHLRKLASRRTVLFDLTDEHRLMWGRRNRRRLAEQTETYLKAWLDRRWTFGMNMGLAPVRRYGKLWRAVQADRWRRACHIPAPRRRYDVAFAGSATGPRASRYNQRVEWMLELAAAGRHRYWGGLLSRSLPEQTVHKYGGDLSHLLLRRKIRFSEYYQALRQSRVALAPAGDAPWTYRHYEAIYAGAMVVTTRMTGMETLIPLPCENMVHVADHEPILPAVDTALALARSSPAMAEENIAFLERYLSAGMYSRRKPELFDRFMAQLPAASNPRYGTPIVSAGRAA